MLLAAQVESLAVNGVALALKGWAIGIRGLALLPHAGRFDERLVLATLSELGPYDADGRYGHVAFRVPVTLPAVRRTMRQEHFFTNTPFVLEYDDQEAATVHMQWAFDGERLSVKYETTSPLDFVVLLNGCVAPAKPLAVHARGAQMRQDDLEVRLDLCSAATAFASAASADDAEALLRGATVKADREQRVTAHRISLRPDAPLHLVLTQASGLTAAASAAGVDQAIADARAIALSHQMDSGGAHADCADAINRLVGWSASYLTQHRKRSMAVNRDWCGSNAPIPVFMWDSFFNAILAAPCDPKLAREALLHITEVIDRGMAAAPPQRNLIVPVVYSKTVRLLGDRDLAQRTFGAMMKFVRFFFEDRGDGQAWRDGNGDGLIECGSCLRPGDAPLGTILQNAFDETGYDDSPMYCEGFAFQRLGLPADGVEYDFNRGTLNLTMVGQNALYVAACRSMAVVARWLDRADDAAWLAAEADRVAARMKESLYDAQTGIFLNRFYDGHFSPVKTPDIFAPLLAEVADEPTAKRLKEILLDPRQFWGDNIVPTVSRDDPSYQCDPWREPYWQGNYWRGNIWAPTNYIVYLSAIAAGWTDLQGEFAAKCRRLFLDDWRPHRFAMENYPPEGKTDRTHFFAGNGGRDTHYVWGGILALISLEELFSVEDTCEGLRLGTLDPQSFGHWSNFRFHDRVSSIRADENGVRLSVEGELEFESDAPIRVRRLVLSPRGGSFSYTSDRNAAVRVEFMGKSCTLTLPAGRERPVEFAFEG